MLFPKECSFIFKNTRWHCLCSELSGTVGLSAEATPSPRRPCLCISSVSPRPQAFKHILNHPCNPHSQRQTTVARYCYLNLYFVSDCDDLTEKNKRICLYLQLSLEEISLLFENRCQTPKNCILYCKSYYTLQNYW